MIIIQEKLDGIKSRYAEITTSSSRALKTLEQVLQLATKFQAFNEELCGWLDAVESELAASTPQSPIGEQIPQLHERQKVSRAVGHPDSAGVNSERKKKVSCIHVSPTIKEYKK